MNGMIIEEAALHLGRSGTGNRSQLSGPSDTFRTKDGWVLVQTVGQPLFERWVRLVGEPELLDDPRFATDTARGENGVALSDSHASMVFREDDAGSAESRSRRRRSPPVGSQARAKR